MDAAGCGAVARPRAVHDEHVAYTAPISTALARAPNCRPSAFNTATASYACTLRDPCGYDSPSQLRRNNSLTDGLTAHLSNPQRAPLPAAEG